MIDPLLPHSGSSAKLPAPRREHASVSAPEVDPTLITGRGSCIGHHGELLQGSFWDRSRGKYVPGLLTLPLPSRRAYATFRPRDSQAGVRVQGAHSKSAKAAELTLELCSRRGLNRPTGGHLHLSSDIHRGWGMGSSTADVVATIRAVCDCCGLVLDEKEVSAIAVRAETASDPLAFDTTPVLFAQRDAHVLQRWEQPLPPLWLVGCILDVEPIDTVSMGPTRYSTSERTEFDRLRGLLDRAVRRRDPKALGRIATRSALINQRHLPKPHLGRVLDICGRTGGVGVQIAHSGNVCSIMYDATDPGVASRAFEARRELTDLSLPTTIHELWENP